MNTLLLAHFSLLKDTECLIKNQPYPGRAAFLSDRKLVGRFCSCLSKIYFRNCAFVFYFFFPQKLLQEIRMPPFLLLLYNNNKKSLSLTKSTVTLLVFFCYHNRTRIYFKRYHIMDFSLRKCNSEL